MHEKYLGELEGSEEELASYREHYGRLAKAHLMFARMNLTTDILFNALQPFYPKRHYKFKTMEVWKECGLKTLEEQTEISQGS
jgi:hypothetical protein